MQHLLPPWSTFDCVTFSGNYRLPLRPALGHRIHLRTTTEHKHYRKIMTSEAPGTLPKHKLHVCSQMETNGCLPWRPHKKNAVTFTVKCNLLFNMQQTEIKESWEWTTTESSSSTSDFLGRSRPFKKRSGPPEMNRTSAQIRRLRLEKVAGSLLCWVGQGRELVWHDVPHSGSLLRKGRELMLMNRTKETMQALYGKRLRHVAKFMYTGSSCAKALLSISRMQPIRTPIPCQCVTKWQQSHPKFPVERCQQVLTKAPQCLPETAVV